MLVIISQMDGSCGDSYACSDATIPLVCNSCKGQNSCSDAGRNNYASIKPPMVWGGRVGKIINSCQDNRACMALEAGHLGLGVCL